MIIDGRQKKTKRRFELLLTGIGWAYMLSAFLQIVFTLGMWAVNMIFGVNYLFSSDSIYPTVKVLLITVFVAAISFLILYGWSEYNYRRYAKLKRRRFSGHTSNQELADYFKLPVEQIEEMQKSKYIELNNTIV